MNKIEKKYAIPALGAIAVSMTACPTVADSPDGQWEASEFNGNELAGPYSQDEYYTSYLSLSMTLSNGGDADLVWTLSYDGEAGTPVNLSGDYLVDDSGKYDILVEGNGTPAKLNFVCTYNSDALSCASGTMNDTTSLGMTYFDRIGGKTE